MTIALYVMSVDRAICVHCYDNLGCRGWREDSDCQFRFDEQTTAIGASYLTFKLLPCGKIFISGGG
jgi:hypothetical protein